jgi:hypothetical protein
MSTDGSDEFELIARNLNHATRQVMPRARRAMKKALTDISTGAKNRAPVDTGALKNSISTQTQGNRDYARGEVGPAVNYGAFVEQALGQIGDDLVGEG